MVNHYTAAKRRRSTDAYTPGGQAGFRPDYAASVYCRILKQLYPDVPVVLGGIEGSLRRVTHYDYWSDQLKPSILVDSGADLLVYGMGEQALRAIVHLLSKGVPFSSLKTIPQTAFLQAESQALPKNKNWQTLRSGLARGVSGRQENLCPELQTYRAGVNKGNRDNRRSLDESTFPFTKTVCQASRPAGSGIRPWSSTRRFKPWAKPRLTARSICPTPSAPSQIH